MQVMNIYMDNTWSPYHLSPESLSCECVLRRYHTRACTISVYLDSMCTQIKIRMYVDNSSYVRGQTCIQRKEKRADHTTCPHNIYLVGSLLDYLCTWIVRIYREREIDSTYIQRKRNRQYVYTEKENTCGSYHLSPRHLSW